jgi:predicted nucleic acid-binding protein
LQKGKGPSEIFIDTTYLLPFLQVPIGVKGFELSDFKALLANLRRVHVSELSVYEAKAKLLRLHKVHQGYEKALRAFGENLNVLRMDEKFVFERYTGEADQRLNQLSTIAKGLDAFDLIILAEALRVGHLLTEDSEILSFRDSEEFGKNSLLKAIGIMSWRDVVTP